ncbi:hypothetical protein ACFPME_11195 [Rhodanobacter umsongensis]|uniref:Uncharacterized protein n=1 Tax=Rhodanobacter umsongensis TaxID=633153 RepID=A0ABW0JMU4_9GAMM
MSLKDAFPPAYQEQHVRKNLVPGTVIRFEARMDDGEIQPKRFVVLDSSDNTLTVVINSDLNAILKARDLLVCQVTMPVSQHPFMKRDSNIDCSRVRAYDTEELVRQLVATPDWLLGSISEDTRNQMLAALKQSRTESPQVIRACCRNLEAIPPAH